MGPAREVNGDEEKKKGEVMYPYLPLFVTEQNRKGFSRKLVKS